MTLALGVGALQMFQIRAGLVTDYGADTLGTAWLYAMFRQGSTVFQRGRMWSAAVTAGFVFLGCAGSEIGQRIGVVPGVFDPLDLVAFAATVLILYAVDRKVVALA